MADLRRRLTAENGLVRWRAHAEAVEFLRVHDLVRGVPDLVTGEVHGASPGAEQRIALLPAEARADALAVNELTGLSGVPSTVPGRRATALSVLFGGGVPAVLGQLPGMLLGGLTGDFSRLWVAAAGAGVGLAGALGVGVADRALTRQTARLAAVEQARSGPGVAVRAVLESARAQLAADLDAAAAEAADAGAEQVRSPGGDQPHRPLRRLLAGPRDGAARPGVDERRGPGPSEGGPGAAVGDRAAAELLEGAAPDVAARLPSYGAWLTRAATGPAVALLGIGVLAAASLPFAPALAASLGVSALGVFSTAAAQRGLAGARERAVIARDGVRAAREEAQTRASADLDLHQAVADRERAARDLAAVRARLAAAGGGPALDPVAVAARPAPDGQLAPGAADGVLTREALGPADRARLDAVEAAARAVVEARTTGARRALSAATDRLRAAAHEAGMALDPVGVEPDPDRAGWPRRRALLAPAARVEVQALDPVPSGAPALPAYLGAALVGTGLPGAAAATAAALVGVGVGPLALVTIGLGPVAAAAAAAVRTRQVVRAEERAADRRAAMSAELPAAARETLAAEVGRVRAETTALTAEAEDRVARAVAAEHSRDVLDDRRTRRADRPLRRLVDAIVGAADEPAAVPADPPAALPSTALEPVAPGPVAASPPVRTSWARALATGVAGPVTVAAGAVAVWQVAWAERFGPLLDPATWAALDASTGSGAGAAVAALTAAGSVAALLGAVGADLAASASTSSKNAAAARRADALAAHEAYRARALRDALLGADHAAVRSLRDTAADRRRTVDAGRLAVLRAADGALPVRPGGVVPRLLVWLAGRSDDTVRAVLREAEPGSELHLAALARLAERLPQVPAGHAAELGPAVLDSVARAGLHHDRPTGHPALDDLVVALHDARPAAEEHPGAPAGPPARPGIDWAAMVRLANATGWWDEYPDSGRLQPPGAPPALPAELPAAPPRPTGTPAAPTPPRPAAPGTPPVSGGPRPAARPPHPYRVTTGGVGAADPTPIVVRETWPDGAGWSMATVVTVRSPGGAGLPLLVRWVVSGPGRPAALVLSEVPGNRFWWGAPDAVLQAVVAALDALGVVDAQQGGPVVVGERPDERGLRELAEFRVDLRSPRQPRFVGPPRVLPPEEVGAATAALRLRPVDEVLAGLAQPAVSR